MKILINQDETHFDLPFLQAGFPHVFFRMLSKDANPGTELDDAEVLVTSSTRYTPRVSDAIRSGAASLRWIHFTTSGIDVLAQAGRLRPDLIVTNSASVHTDNVSEHAFALLLFLTRRLRDIESAQAAREWNRSLVWTSSRTLAGTTMMVVGLGAIGRAVARKAQAFDMKVIGVSRSRKCNGIMDIRSYAELRGSLPDADVVVICAPLDSVTEGLIDARAFAAMKKEAILINISRGGIVNESDLVAALTEGKLGGVGMDVAAAEPLPADSPLWRFSNVLISPHCAGAGTQFGKRVAHAFGDQLEKYLRGAPLCSIEGGSTGRPDVLLMNQAGRAAAG